MLASIEQIFEANPRILFLFIIFMLGIIYCPLGILVAISLNVFTQRLKYSSLWLFFVSLLLSGVVWKSQSISPLVVIKINHIAFNDLLRGHWDSLSNVYLFLMTVPQGMLLAALVQLFMHPRNDLQKKLKRVSEGKMDLGLHKISQKAAQKKLAEIKTSACEGGSIMGIDCNTGMPVTIMDKAANMHTLAIGTTGSGKTTSICNIVESAIVRNLPLFYVDGKGDSKLAQSMGDFAKQQGRPFYLFSMVGESVKYNPIALGGITSKKDRIIELRTWSEDHYRKIAEGYLQTVFSILDGFNLKLDLMGLSQYLHPDALYDLAREKQAPSVISEIEALEAKYRDVSSLLAEIDNMTQSEIGHLFDTRSGTVLTLDKALEENVIVYFCLQPLAFPAYAECLGKLIINDLKALAAQQLQKDKQQKIYCIFDEFSVFAGDQIINLINQGRSAGIHAILATQSISDIAKKGGDALVGQVLNNCNNFIIQRQNNHDDAELLAKLIGTQDGFQLTSQIDKVVHNRTVGSVRTAKEFIVHPDVIKGFRQGEGVLLSKVTGEQWVVRFRRGKC